METNEATLAIHATSSKIHHSSTKRSRDDVLTGCGREWSLLSWSANDNAVVVTVTS